MASNMLRSSESGGADRAFVVSTHCIYKVKHERKRGTSDVIEEQVADY
jgi:hypothetical protein